MKVVFGLLVTAAFIVSFQNCSQPFGFEKLDLKSAANGNGTGYDGKPFVNHGVCDLVNGTLEIKSTIFLQADHSGLLVRDECQDLANPVVITTDMMRASSQDSGIFVYKRQIYDEYAPPNGVKRKLTRLLCFTFGGSMPTETESRVWYYGDALSLNASSPVLYAQQTDTAGYNSGKLYPLNEQITSMNLIYTYLKPSSSESMTVNVNLGSTMNYGMSQVTDAAGAVTAMAGGLDCVYQALPKQ